MSESAIEMKFSQLSVKLDKIEEIQKITMEAHGTKQTEDKINVRISKLQNEINEDIKEMKAEVNAGRATVVESFTVTCDLAITIILSIKDLNVVCRFLIRFIMGYAMGAQIRYIFNSHIHKYLQKKRMEPN